jgi:type VI protein secretion system component Hcp
MALYLKFDNLQGDVTEKNYKNYSTICALNFPAISTGCANALGRSEYHAGGLPHFSTIQIIKPLDSVSLLLASAASCGRVFKEVTFVDTGAQTSDNQTPFLQTVFKNVRISYYAKKHWGEGVTPCEIISFTYSSYTDRLTGKNADGSYKTPQAAGFDLEKIKAL